MDSDFERLLVDEAGMEYHSTDKKGNVSRYRLYKGHKYSPPQFSANVPERLEEIANMEIRKDDILLCMYPKSGTHWLHNVVAMVVRGNTEYVGTPPLLDFTNLVPLRDMESPRILGTHLPFECLPIGCKEGKSKIITVTRNPKDVAASFYAFSLEVRKEVKFCECDWDGFLNFFSKNEMACDSWFQYVKMWEPAVKQYPDTEILFLSFENMKKNLYENIVKVAKFLGVQRSEEFLKEVETKCTFSNMKNDVNKGRKPEKEWFIASETGILPIYRKGEVGDWKNWFTVAQSEKFDAIYEQELKGHDISFVYKPEN